MGKQQSDIQFNPFKRKAKLEDDRNVQKDTTPEAKEQGKLAKFGNFLKRSGQSVGNAVLSKGKGIAKPFVEINERAERGEKVKISEVVGTVARTGLDIGITAATGGGNQLAGEAITQLSEVAVKSNLVTEGTGDKLKHGLKIVVDPKDALKESLLNKSIEFAKQNDPTNTTQTIDDATNLYKSLKKPQKLSDVTVASKVVAKAVAKKNQMVSATDAETQWKSYIFKKLSEANNYLQANGKDYMFETPSGKMEKYNGINDKLREELTEGLFRIFKRNSSSKTLFTKYLGSARKLKMLVDFYARPDVRAVIDGNVSFPEEYYLSHFMKQYLTHNGIFNMPSATESTSNSNMLAFGASEDSYAGSAGIKVECINPGNSVVYKSIPNQTDSTEHREGGLTHLILQAKDANGKKLKTELEFSEYLGKNAKSGQCEDDSCKKCGSFDRILKDTIKCKFSYDGAMQIWFKVKDIANEGDAGDVRGFYFSEGQISKFFRENAVTFNLKPNNKKNVA